MRVKGSVGYLLKHMHVLRTQYITRTFPPYIERWRQQIVLGGFPTLSVRRVSIYAFLSGTISPLTLLVFGSSKSSSSGSSSLDRQPLLSCEIQRQHALAAKQLGRACVCACQREKEKHLLNFGGQLKNGYRASWLRELVRWLSGQLVLLARPVKINEGGGSWGGERGGRKLLPLYRPSDRRQDIKKRKKKLGIYSVKKVVQKKQQRSRKGKVCPLAYIQRVGRAVSKEIYIYTRGA